MLLVNIRLFGKILDYLVHLRIFCHSRRSTSQECNKYYVTEALITDSKKNMYVRLWVLWG